MQNAAYMLVNKPMRMFLQTILILALSGSCATPDTVPVKNLAADSIKTTVMDTDKVVKSEEEWRQQLTPEQYNILREKGTERAFTGEYWDNHEKGIYKCAACGTVLFASEQKFDSGCGWPSFSLPWDSTVVDYHKDSSYGMTRTEVTCKKCGGHLGHVFDDGPPPTGLRYCINSGSMVFEKNP
jgi:peptide-methionine (R)-S-oxide reductase